MLLIKKSVAITLSLSFILSVVPISFADTIQAGSIIPVSFAESVNSKTAIEGQTVMFTVTEDIKDAKTHNVVIRQGTSALGQVSRVEKTGALGKKGELGIQIQRTTAVDGTPVNLQAVTGKDGQGKTGTAIGWGVIGGLLFLPLAFFLLKKGKNAEIPAGTKLNAYVVADVQVTVN